MNYKYIYLFPFVLTVVSYINASLKPSGLRTLYSMEQTQKASSNKNWTFEIMNKTNKPIWVNVSTVGQAITSEAKKVDAMTANTRGFLRIAGLDTSQTIMVKIYFSQKEAEGRYSTNYKFYEIVTNKPTIYLTWDGTILRPQTGPFLG